jgi:hypothetical protein
MERAAHERTGAARQWSGAGRVEKFVELLKVWLRHA